MDIRARRCESGSPWRRTDSVTNKQYNACASPNTLTKSPSESRRVTGHTPGAPRATVYRALRALELGARGLPAVRKQQPLVLLGARRVVVVGRPVLAAVLEAQRRGIRRSLLDDPEAVVVDQTDRLDRVG